MEAKKYLSHLLELEEPEWLKDFRKKSFEKYESLPPENSNTFKNQTLFLSFNPDLKIREIEKLKSEFAVPGDAIFIINGRISYPKELEKKGLIILNLQDAMQKFGNELKEILENQDQTDKFCSLNNALFFHGLFIKVPENLEVESPLRIIDFISSDIFSKIFIIQEKNSKLRILKESYSRIKNESIFSENLEIFLKENTHLEFSDIQNLPLTVQHLTHKRVTCGKDSKIFWNIGMFGGSRVRSRVLNVLQGDGSLAEDLEVILGTKGQKFDSFSSLVHIGKSTTGKVMTKSILKDQAESILKGMIRIEKSAKNSNSYLAEHSMLLSKEAKAKAIPGLEIETNEVKATHSASVAQLDDEKIFYMTSRGLNEDQSKMLVVMGFFEPIIQSIAIDETKDKINQLIELKWTGKDENIKDQLGSLSSVKNRFKTSKDIFEGHYKYR